MFHFRGQQTEDDVGQCSLAGATSSDHANPLAGFKSYVHE